MAVATDLADHMSVKETLESMVKLRERELDEYKFVEKLLIAHRLITVEQIDLAHRMVRNASSR